MSAKFAGVILAIAGAIVLAYVFAIPGDQYVLAAIGGAFTGVGIGGAMVWQ